MTGVQTCALPILSLDVETVGAKLTGMAMHVEKATGRKADRFLVQQMVPGGVELILGFRRDPLGTAILLGMGGVTAELFNDTALRMLQAERPLSREDALGMAMELRTWPLLDGYRGRAKSDVDALVSAIVAFSQMACALGERLIEAEINPLFVLPQGQGEIGRAHV